MPPRCQLLAAMPSTFRIAVRTSIPAQRAYATATATPPPVVKNPLKRRKGGDLGSHLPKDVIPQDAYIPPYPHGDHILFKQANRGLYGLQRIQFGNNVSHKSETKTRRNWKPNVLTKSLYSVALRKKIKLRVTSKVLKTMDREGGLDEYLLKDSQNRLKEIGPLGWALRWTLLQRTEVIERMRADAASWGIDQATIDKQWPLPAQRTSVQDATSGFVTASDLIGATSEDFETEYIKAIKAANLYFEKGWVDNVEDAIKVSFLRAPERAQEKAQRRADFLNLLKEMFSADDVVQTRRHLKLPASLSDDAVREKAWNQKKSEGIKEAGSVEAWRATLDNTVNAQEAKEIELAGSPEAFVAKQKAAFAELLEEAKTASTDESIDEERRVFLQIALEKAQRAIEARENGGAEAYAEATMAALQLDDAEKLQNAQNAA